MSPLLLSLPFLFLLTTVVKKQKNANKWGNVDKVHRIQKGGREIKIVSANKTAKKIAKME
jgi:hypothetical protein